MIHMRVGNAAISGGWEGKILGVYFGEFIWIGGWR